MLEWRICGKITSNFGGWLILAPLPCQYHYDRLGDGVFTTHLAVFSSEPDQSQDPQSRLVGSSWTDSPVTHFWYPTKQRWWVIYRIFSVQNTPWTEKNILFPNESFLNIFRKKTYRIQSLKLNVFLWMSRKNDPTDCKNFLFGRFYQKSCFYVSQKEQNLIF